MSHASHAMRIHVRKSHFDMAIYMTGAFILVASLILRIASYPVITDDYRWFLSEWFQELAQKPGLTAFESVFSNYAPMYLYFLKFLTLFPVASLYSIKTLSFVFDIIVALFATLIAAQKRASKQITGGLFLFFTVILSIPTVMLNSSMWAQSDSIYTAGVMASLYFIIAKNPILAAASFGFAFSVKAQSVIFLPVLAGYLLRKKRTARYLLIVPLIYILSIIPAWIAGGSLSQLLLVYFSQAGEYDALSMQAPNMYALLNEHALSQGLRTALFYIGIALAGLFAFWITRAMKYARNKHAHTHIAVFMGLFSVLTLAYVLPGMHERYFYLADILSVVYAWYNPRRWYIPILVIAASFFAYMPYLSAAVGAFGALNIGTAVPSLAMFSALVLLAYKHPGFRCYCARCLYFI